MCFLCFTLNFIIASFFYIFFSSFNKLIHWKKVSFHVLFCAQKIHLHLIRVSNYAPSACSTLIRFTRGSQSTSTVFFFTLFSLKDMNVCVIHGFPLTNHWIFYVLGFIFNQFVVVCLGVSKIIIIMVKHQNRNFWVHKTRPMRAFSPVRESTFRFSLSINYLEAKKKILFSINIINEYYINRHAHLNLFSL